MIGRNQYKVFEYMILIMVFFSFAFFNLSYSFEDFSALQIDDIQNLVPVAIIGSGPAGLTSGMYASRAGYHTVVFEGPLPGGQLVNAAWVENWPGLSKIDGKTAIAKLKKQAENFDVKMSDQTIKSVDFNVYPFKLYTNEDEVINALSVIIASGATPRKLGVPGEKKYWGKGIQECALCDAPLYRKKNVIIVGGGDASIEQALLLKPYAKKITILVRAPKMRACKYMRDKLKMIPQVEVFNNVEVQRFEGIKNNNGDDERVNKVVFLDKKADKIKELDIDGAFISIGQQANTEFLKDHISLNSNGCIKTSCMSQETSVKGVFAAGNVCDNLYRQAAVASGLGCKAALNAKDYLISKNIDIDKNQKNIYLYDSYNSKKLKESINSIKKEEKVVDHNKNNHEISNLNDFNNYISEAKKPVLVFLFSPACPHCHKMIPIVDSMILNDSQLDILKIDVSKSNDIAMHFNIIGVPTFVIMKDGKKIEQFSGSMSEDQFRGKISTILLQ